MPVEVKVKLSDKLYSALRKLAEEEEGGDVEELIHELLIEALIEKGFTISGEG